MASVSPPSMARSDSELSSLSSLSEPSELLKEQTNRCPRNPAKRVKGRSASRSSSVHADSRSLYDTESVIIDNATGGQSTLTDAKSSQLPYTPISLGNPASADPAQHTLPTPPPKLTDKQYLDAIFGKPFDEVEALDLSDGEEDEDDYEEPSADGIRRRKRLPGQRMRPAYYYPSTESKANSRRGVPVFEPTMEEFSDFYNFINRVDKYGMRSGLVKVVPPKEWHDKLPSVDHKLRSTRIKDPISELMHGSSGLYRQTNITKTRMWNAKQWQDLSFSERYATPDFFSGGKDKEGDEGGEGSSPAKKQTKRASAPKRKKTVKVQASEESQNIAEAPSDANGVKQEIEGTGLVEQPVSAEGDADQPVPAETAMDAAETLSLLAQPDVPAPMDVDSQCPTSDLPEEKPKVKKLSTFARTEATDEEWSSFDWKKMIHDAKPEDFTVEACREIERRYWRTLTFGEPPMYGADMQGSLFTSDTTEWNVANLDDLLRKLRPNQRIPGVNTPYLYFGMWRATFAWHVEDADLYSINYVHFGAPKFWYSVPQEESERFERVMESFFPQDRQRCSEFLRHKSFLASPIKLENQGIHLNRVVQLPGEFILTYPRGYHSGFNVGYNCAESINFATSKWLEIGRKAHACSCVEDSVSINVDAWLFDALNEANEERANPHKRKRRERDPNAEPVPKKPRMLNEAAIKKAAEREAKEARKAEKLRQEQAAQAAAIARSNQFVCVLCPDTTRKSLVKLAPPRNLNAKPDPRRRTGYAHKLCVMFCPATWISPDPATGEELVHGFENIERARWDLKCQLCTEKHGVKVQCTKAPKCVRAHHVTCAVKENTGVIIDAVVGEGMQQVSLIDSAREEGGSIFDIFDLQPAVNDLEEGSEDAAMSPNAADAPVPAISPRLPTLNPEIFSQQASANPAEELNAVTQSPTASALSPGTDDPINSIKLVVCCRQHNPDWVKQQAKLKSSSLLAKISAVPIGGMIRIKTSGGLFHTKLVANLPDRESVQVQFPDDNKIQVYKYSAVTWKDPPVVPVAVPRPSHSVMRDDFVYDHKPSVQRKRSALPPIQTITQHVPPMDSMAQHQQGLPLPQAYAYQQQQQQQQQQHFQQSLFNDRQLPLSIPRSSLVHPMAQQSHTQPPRVVPSVYPHSVTTQYPQPQQQYWQQPFYPPPMVSHPSQMGRQQPQHDYQPHQHGYPYPSGAHMTNYQY